MNGRLIEVDLSEDGNRLVIRCSALDAEQMKSISGVRFDSDRDCFVAFATWQVCRTLAGMFGERLNVTSAAREKADAIYERIVLPRWNLRQVYILNPLEEHEILPMRARLTSEGRSLRHYQEAGALFLSEGDGGGAALFDPMGTGKTVQMLVALRMLSERGEAVLPMLVICPNSVKAVWLEHGPKWWPELRIADAGNAAATRKAVLASAKAGELDVVVINWEGLPKNSRLASYGQSVATRGEKEPGPLNVIPWKTIVADEAHRAKNPHAKQTRALWALGDGAMRRFALTGTPMANTPLDLWSILRFLEPAGFAGRSKWMERYLAMGLGVWGTEVYGIRRDTREEFNDTTEYLWRRVPKEVALPELPPKVPTTRFCEMGRVQMKHYVEMRDRQITELGNGEQIVAFSALSKLARLCQFASATADIDETGTVTLQEPSCKLDELLAIRDELGDQPLVVFAESRKWIEMVSRHFDKAGVVHGLVTGKQSLDERRVNVARFQDGKTNLILLTMAAGGEGITLTAAGTLVFAQRSFSLIRNQQSEDRAHRIGSEIHESVNIIDLVTRGTVDEHVMQIATMKNAQLQEFVRDRDAILRMLGTK